MEWHNSHDPVVAFRTEALSGVAIETNELPEVDDLTEALSGAYPADDAAAILSHASAHFPLEKTAGIVMHSAEPKSIHPESTEYSIYTELCPTSYSSSHCSPVWPQQVMPPAEQAFIDHQQMTLDQSIVDFDTTIWTNTINPTASSLSPEELLEATAGAALLLPALDDSQWQRTGSTPSCPPEMSSVMPSPEQPGLSSPTTVYCCYEHGCNGRKFSSSSTYRRHCREQSACHKQSCAFCGQQFSRASARDMHLSQGRCKATQCWSLT